MSEPTIDVMISEVMRLLNEPEASAVRTILEQHRETLELQRRMEARLAAKCNTKLVHEPYRVLAVDELAAMEKANERTDD
jgi:hypothetical protein